MTTPTTPETTSTEVTAALEEISSVQKRIKVSISAESVDTAFNKAYSNIRKKAKIQGFRPGKAPLGMIKKLYGASVASQVGEDLINQNLFETIREQNLRIISSPVIEAMKLPEAGKEYEFSAVVDIMPTLENVDFKNVSIEVHKHEVKPEDVEKELNNLARRSAKTTPIEDSSVAADKGHLVTLSHEVSLEGKTIEQMNVEKVQVALGEQELYPELESAILGMKTGENKKVDITLPSDFQDAELAGKTVNFDLTVDALSLLELPTIDDEFAKDLNVDSKDALVQQIEDGLKKQAEGAKKRELEVKLLDVLRQKNAFEVPPAMVDEVIDSMIKEMYPGDSEPSKNALKDEKIRGELKEEAKRRAQNTILLWEIAKSENIEVSDDDIAGHIKKMLGKEGDESEEVKSQVEMFKKSVGSQVKENLLLDKSLDAVIEAANIKELDH